MADGVENDDYHSIHSSIHSSSESDVNFLEEVDSDSETFSDFDFDFCKALNFDENLVDDVDDWEVDSDIDNDLNAIDNQNLFKRRLCHWAVDSNVARESVNKLLQVLRTDPSNSFLPKTYKTLLGTPRKVHVIAASPGFYYGFTILDGIVCSLNSINVTFSSNSHELKMLVGCDGTSFGKSTNSQLWPILGKVCMDGAQCFDIGFYHGHAKPDDINSYLKHFCDEISKFMNEGFQFKGCHIKIRVESFCCDAPASSFIKNVKPCGAYYGCMKCEVEGVYVRNKSGKGGRVTYPEIDAILRTDECFRDRDQINHHSGFSNLENLSINMVDDFCIGLFPPDWYQGAVFAGTAEDRARHLFFFTPTMKRQLEDCKTWFMDATFYFVDEPIKQLFTINGFIKNDKNEIKQIPLLFCCMTRRRAADYSAVFQKIKEIIPLPRVQRIVTDFERAIFTAVRKHFVDCQHFGCNFHWCQAVLKKVRDLHLATIYNNKGPNPVRDFVFRLLCLAYLPAGKIPGVFDALKSSAPSELTALMDYMERNWIRGKFWTPDNWSCFNLLTRTNNDCEGMHHQWNKLAGGSNLKFYKMTMVLRKLAEDVSLTSTLLCHDKIKAHRKKDTQLKNSILFQIWARYQNNELSTMDLLEEIVKELKSSFPSVVSSHALNIANNNFNDELDMSVNELP
ncbi:uncharacterized protein LOC116930737 isoform X1 [Daphnia magna]|uniref:MULE transposase domain-containing protein n=4 Tax=Daphnia magna TaxID=35525 RepID=A0ABR0AG56_9CRUS|nr:uncharacterized protein LOC116930737 isoform X1 [Daphnia magna]XP_045026549.1 uncharacterized protein LOC116930737 isoform X1 [Daphnia magna]XP_045026550.1 uncharacterized protein LOC116930737 isoform X1 [Daphnia magna]KAK4024107.1 hypothetical protein OUZ56_009496 [Daphnia magna]